MKLISSLVALLFFCSCATGKEQIYTGSTPAGPGVKDFLDIPLADSIDFVRWKLVIRPGEYELFCQYGLSKPNTNGFIHPKKAEFSGKLRKEKNQYYLEHGDKVFLILEINPNLLHLMDANKNLLAGNGGYSYTLNSVGPVKSDQFAIQLQQGAVKNEMAYEGRTPCRELNWVSGNNSACIKLKWYFLFYTDSITGRPSHYFSAGTGYRKETMARGKWQIISGKGGRVIYKLDPEGQKRSLYLVKASENVLLFTDSTGNLLVGNEDFSYTLNRRYEPYPRVPR